MCNHDFSTNTEPPTECPVCSLEKKVADLSDRIVELTLQTSEVALQLQTLVNHENKSFVDNF